MPFQFIRIDIARLLNIDVDTGSGVLDLLAAVLLLAVAFAGILLIRVTYRWSRKPKGQKQ